MHALVFLMMLLIGGEARAVDVNQCRIDVTPVRFGTYNPFATADARANGVVAYSCTISTPISISLDHGGGGSLTTRTMRMGAEVLEYNLYMDAACSIVWGDGTGGSQIYREAAPPPDTNVSVPIYGCIRAGQRGRIGGYQENLAVTINF